MATTVFTGADLAARERVAGFFSATALGSAAAFVAVFGLAAGLGFADAFSAVAALAGAVRLRELTVAVRVTGLLFLLPVARYRHLIW